MIYYSLKTKTEEHCLEPRIFGGYDYGVYDLEHNLIGEKTLVKEEEVVKFIFDKQKELGGKFDKLELSKTKRAVKRADDELLKEATESTPAEKVEKKAEPVLEPKEELKSESVLSGILDDLFSRKKATGDASGRLRALSDTVESFGGGKLGTHIRGAHVSTKELEEKKNKFTMEVEVDYENGEINVQVGVVPSDDAELVATQAQILVDKLFPVLLAKFPMLVDNLYIACAAKSVGCSYEEAEKNYRDDGDLGNATRMALIRQVAKVLRSDSYRPK